MYKLLCSAFPTYQDGQKKYLADINQATAIFKAYARRILSS